MKLNIRYSTKERKYINKNVYQYISKDVELEPLRIMRSPCGIGAAANRYYYIADFKAPDDAEFEYNGLIREHINRKTNPNFDPKKLLFKDDVWSA